MTLVILFGTIVIAVVTVLVYRNFDAVKAWMKGAYRSIAKLGEGFENSAPPEEKLRVIVNDVVKNNKSFSDFSLEVSKAGLDPERYNVRAFGHLVLLRHQKGANLTKEQIRAKLAEYGI